MIMLESLLQLDTNWLVAINGWHAAWADVWMWNISERLTWLPLYLVLVAGIVMRYKKKSIWILLAFGACVGLADFISSGIIKELVMRPRPSREPALEGILHIVNNYRGGRFGFVSSHAANTIGISLLFCLIWRDWRATVALSLFTALNCYSRMYLGVHYPLDILGGLVVGSLVAWGLYYLLRVSHALPKEMPTVGQAWHWSILSITFLSLIVFFFPLGL